MKAPNCKSIWYIDDWGAEFACDRSEGHPGQHKCSWRDESYPYTGGPNAKFRSITRLSFCWKALKDEPIPIDHYSHPEFKRPGVLQLEEGNA